MTCALRRSRLVRQSPWRARNTCAEPDRRRGRGRGHRRGSAGTRGARSRVPPGRWRRSRAAVSVAPCGAYGCSPSAPPGPSHLTVPGPSRRANPRGWRALDPVIAARRAGRVGHRCPGGGRGTRRTPSTGRRVDGADRLWAGGAVRTPPRAHSRSPAGRDVIRCVQAAPYVRGPVHTADLQRPQLDQVCAGGAVRTRARAHSRSRRRQLHQLCAGGAVRTPARAHSRSRRRQLHQLWAGGAVRTPARAHSRSRRRQLHQLWAGGAVRTPARAHSRSRRRHRHQLWAFTGRPRTAEDPLSPAGPSRWAIQDLNL